MAHAMKRTTSSTKARNQIGGRIRQARQKCSPPVSQEDLAGRLAGRGISLDRSAISRIENQDRYLMDYEISAIARCLNVSVGWLFGESERT
jgi:transcriptional regulator with XRE-family HTH domain